MKNKLLVALIAITVMLCGAFAFTACGGNEQSTETNGGITAEELKQAMQATFNAQNGKMGLTIVESGGTPRSGTFYYDYENGTAKYGSSDQWCYVVTGKESVWVYDLQYEHCSEAAQDSVKEHINSSNPSTICLYKSKDDDSAQFAPIEDNYASFKYDSVTDTYSATLLGFDNCYDSEKNIYEINVSLTVEKGYVRKFEFKCKNESETSFIITYSDLGTVEVTVPDEVMKLVQAREQNN